jgi:S1-C subfamily serine protease
MPIKLTILGGPLDGRVFEFGADKAQITLGRLPDRDVQFPVEMTTVSRAHLTIVQENARYFLRPDEPVYLDGEEALRDDPLPPRCEIALRTRDGQKIRIEWHEGGAIPSTQPLPRRAAALAPARQARQAARAAKRLVLVGVAAAALALVALAAVFLSREEPIEARIAAQRASIYLVVWRAPNGAELGGGTAWVVGPGLLATNAHVVEDWDKHRAGGMKGFVRSNVSPHDSIEIAAVQEHPLYRQFTRMLNNYLPVRNNRVVTFVSGYDVALIRVDPAAKLAPPLKIADAATLAALEPGQPIAVIGYPMERMTGGGTDVKSPNPQTQIARLTANTDYFLVRRDTPRNLLVQHSAQTAGGSSGSPIFDAKGAVIGAHNAGNYAFIQQGNQVMRVPLSVGVNFGQRADLVRELIAGTAAAQSAERLIAWRDALKGYEHGPDWVVRGVLGQAKADPNLPALADGTVETAMRPGEKLAVADLDFKTPGRGMIAAFAFGPDAGTLYVFLLQEGGEAPASGAPGFGGTPPPGASAVVAANDKGTSVVPFVTAERDGAMQGRVRVKAPNAGQAVRIRVYFVPRP